MRLVKVAIVKAENPLTNEAVYSVLSGDIEILKYSPMSRVVEMPENEVAQFKESMQAFLKTQYSLQAIFETN